MEAIFVIIGIGAIIWAFSALFSPPKKHKGFSYKDQQRAMRAFDRNEQIDMGIPDGIKDKEKKKK
jgi:hypothetical protein